LAKCSDPGSSPSTSAAGRPGHSSAPSATTRVTLARPHTAVADTATRDARAPTALWRRRGRKRVSRARVLRTASAPTHGLVHPRQTPRQTPQQTRRQTPRHTRTMLSFTTTPHSEATRSLGTAPLGLTPPSYRSIIPLSTPTNPESTYSEGRGRTSYLTVKGLSHTSQTGCSRPQTRRPTRHPRPCFRTIIRTRWCSQWLPRRHKEAGVKRHSDC